MGTRRQSTNHGHGPGRRNGFERVSGAVKDGIAPALFHWHKWSVTLHSSRRPRWPTGRREKNQIRRTQAVKVAKQKMSTTTSTHAITDGVDLAQNFAQDEALPKALRRRLKIATRPQTVVNALEDAAPRLDSTRSYWAMQAAKKIRDAHGIVGI